MPFKEGFDAIAEVKASSQKLGEAVARIEQLEARLSELREAQVGVEEMLGKAKAAFVTLDEATKGMIKQGEQFEKLAQTLPTLAEDVLIKAESRLEKQQAEISRLTQGLPTMVETVVEQKLTAIVAELEGRLTERLRDELKDTRTTLRDAFENKLEETRKNIIAEMPRGLFGRRRE